MAKKKQSAQAGQMPLGDPPDLSEDLVHHWSTLKTIYPAFLILLVKGNYYVTVDWDALTISQTTGHPLVEGMPDLCYFLTKDLDLVLRKLTRKGFFLAICHPPGEPNKHLFT